MRLYLDCSKCVECGECLKACPLLKDNKNYGIMNCNNCKVCVEVCAANAFYDNGRIIAIDYEKCNNCNSCVEACPYKAIIPQQELPAKCDLCADYEKPLCIQACAYNAIKIILDEDERKFVDNVNGWRKKRYEGIEKTIEIDDYYEIAATKKEVIYFTNHFPLSYDESIIASEVMNVLKQEEVNEEKIESEVLWQCNEKGLMITKNQADKIKEFIIRETKELSFIDFFTKDDNIEEIAVIGVNKPLFVYHRKHGWIKTDVVPCSDEKLRRLVNKAGRNTRRRITTKNPVINADLELGRLHAAIPPVSNSTVITIRKFRKKAFTARELVTNETITSEAMAFLSIIIQCGSNVLVCGNTGSGKTTTLNVLASFIPENDRIVIIEETPELIINKQHVIRLVSNKNTPMNELVNNTLRMRPDKVIIGEVRTREEVSALMNTMLAGQGNGCMATFHAQSSEEAIARLVKLGAMEQDLPSIDLIIVQKRWNNPEKRTTMRKIVEISTVESINGKPRIVKVFELENKKLVMKNTSKKLLEKAVLCFDTNKQGVMEKIKERKEWFKQ